MSNLEHAGNRTMFFVIKKVRETLLDFTVKSIVNPSSKFMRYYRYTNGDLKICQYLRLRMKIIC